MDFRRLVDAHGNDIDGDDHEGEILVKGPCMMLGYLDNAVATAGAIDADGWLRTGDIGYRRKGYWYIIDRKKVKRLILDFHLSAGS